MSIGIFLGIGSNLGDRQKNLEGAGHLLSLRILAESSLYETEPVGYLNQPWFLNAVLQVEQALTARELLNRIHEVEHRMGRKREIPKGPRIIDIDILFYNDLILNDPDLIIPHPAVQDRKFVLEPMNEIVPEFKHPLLQKTIRQLLAECPDRSAVRKMPM
jgi:2-amino-4-hydroxy-6-hydroxymethyldihydropteridine diphosphokinase